MKRLLIISPHWPPVNAPDHQRVRMSLPYYRQHGWEPVVLAVHPDDVAGPREPELEQTYPPDVRIVRCRALPLRWTRWVGLGNLGLRAWWSLWRAGSRLLQAEPFDLVLFSSTQFITFTLGSVWRRRFGVPYVIDLQDPWRTDSYERPGAPPPPGGRKYLLARCLAFLLEAPTYRGAAGFISVSPRYLSDLARRYPWFRDKPKATIRFGVSAADFDHVRRHPPAGARLDRRAGMIHLLYTGAAGPILPHALNTLFDGFARYRAVQPERAARFRFHFVGTSYVAPGHGVPSILPVAERFGLTASVEEVPHRIGHLESLALLLQADALLLLGSSDPAYSPSKLYPYFLSGKPILGVVRADSHLEQLLQELSCAWLVTFFPTGAGEAAGARLAAFFDQALAGFPADALPARNEAAFRRDYLAEPLTEAQCDFFAAILTRYPARHARD
ncbi:MAG TPA: hypothetical protein VLT83_10750 [Opitutaceae bacterium]|nr:hypothetical protein [Opitutaceae bacterium]